MVFDACPFILRMAHSVGCRDGSGNRSDAIVDGNDHKDGLRWTTLGLLFNGLPGW